MFFRHVVGKVQLYPYLHIVTWGLPKRYLGLLRIFNLPLEEFPHQFLNQSSDTLNSYEPQVTKKSISPFSPHISTDDLSTPRRFKSEEDIQNALFDQECSGDSPLSLKKGRRPKKKPVISIKVKLDDDLQNLKRVNGKNFDKILLKSKRRSCLLVIEKSNTSKRDEYSLNFVNNTIYSKPYAKLLRKNRKRKNSSVCVSPTEACIKPGKSLSSEFSEENIYPFLKKNENNFSGKIMKSSPLFNGPFKCEYPPPKNIVDKTVQSKEIKDQKYQEKNTNRATETEQTNENTQLAIPSHLVPYEEPVSDEKPLRNWPVITQLFDRDHIEIYKNYLKSLSSTNQEDEEDENQEEVQNGDEIVTIDISDAKSFHESTARVKGLESSVTDKGQNQEETSRNFESSEEPTSESASASFRTSSTIERDHYVKLNEDNNSDTSFSTEKPAVSTNFFIVNENSPFNDSGSQKLYTSTAYLLIGATNEETKTQDKMNDAKSVVNSSKSDSKSNMRLLSHPIRTYESITKNEEESTYYDIKEACDEENLSHNSENSERKKRGMRNLYIFNIVLAVFVTVVLVIILFISFADTSTINRFVDRYIKR